VADGHVGYHALTVVVLGSYLHSFAERRVEAVKEFDLEAVTGDDPKAAKLAPYAQKLPPGSANSWPGLPCFPAA
jgi:hypothetical protein